MSANGFLEAAWKGPAAELSFHRSDALIRVLPTPDFTREMSDRRSREHVFTNCGAGLRFRAGAGAQRPEAKWPGWGVLRVAGSQGGWASAGRGWQVLGYPGIWALLDLWAGSQAAPAPSPAAPVKTALACRGVTRRSAGLPAAVVGWNPVGMSAV